MIDPHCFWFFSFTGCNCSSEVLFVEELENVSNNLVQISNVSSKRDRAPSTLASIQLAAAAGKLSSQVIAAVEELLLHSFVVNSHAGDTDGFKGIDDSLKPVVVCYDLIYKVALPISVCKSIVDYASQLLEAGNLIRFLFWTPGLPEEVPRNSPCPSTIGPSVGPSLNMSETVH